MIPHLYAVDPSTVSTGVAQYLGKQLTAVTVLEADGLEAMLGEVRRFFFGVPSHAVCVTEKPIIYGHRQKADPNDQIKIAQVAGAARVHFHTSYDITPGGWNGSVPYEITENRIKALLTPKEWAMVLAVRAGIRNNAVDAVGVGLHHIGVLRR